MLEIRGARDHNLQKVDVDIPLGVLVVVTGVAGSGKSSLVHGSVAGRDGVVAVDQASIRGSRRSNPATYTGLLDPVRKAFAKANGVKPAFFSANSEGGMYGLQRRGRRLPDLAVMATVASVCEECEGKRFDASVLEYRFGGQAALGEVYAMSVIDAEEFFGSGEARTPAAHTILGRLSDVGLGYFSLGQPLTTHSPAAASSASSSLGASPRRATSTSSTARRRPAFTSPTSSSCSAYSTASSMRASR